MRNKRAIFEGKALLPVHQNERNYHGKASEVKKRFKKPMKPHVDTLFFPHGVYGRIVYYPGKQGYHGPYAIPRYIFAMTAMFGLMPANAGSKHLNEIFILALALAVPVSFRALTERLKNIGVRQMWRIPMLVPAFALIVLPGCPVCPEGYGRTRKLDSAGGIFILIAVLIGIGMTGPRLQWSVEPARSTSFSRPLIR